jgi:hypothetical protein
VITADLMTKALESFPNLEGVCGSMAALMEDKEFACAFVRAVENNDAFVAFAADLREKYTASNQQAWVFINILRCAVQLGYRLHSLELAEDFKL